MPHLYRDWAHPCRICTGTGLTRAASAPGLGSPVPHLHRDWACRARPSAGLSGRFRALWTSRQRTGVGLFLGRRTARSHAESDTSNSTTDCTAVTGAHFAPYGHAVAVAYVVPHRGADSNAVRAPHWSSFMGALCKPVDAGSIHRAAIDGGAFGFGQPRAIAVAADAIVDSEPRSEPRAIASAFPRSAAIGAHD